MALQYLKAFAPTGLTTSAATIYTVPSSPAATLLRGGVVRFTNYSGSPVTVTAHAVPNAGSVANNNAFVYDKSIATGDFLDVAVPVLEAGGTIQALASANTSVNIQFMSGVLQA